MSLYYSTINKKAEASSKIKYHGEECGWESEWVSDTAAEPFHECELNEN